MARNNGDYWGSQAVREYGGLVFAALLFLTAVGVSFLL